MDFLVNRCYRGAPCLSGTGKIVSKEAYFDFYDRGSRRYVFLECRLHQKFLMVSDLERDREEKHFFPTGTQSSEYSDLQLADQNGVWMSRSEDEACYQHTPFEEPKTCSDCDISICDIRDWEEYLDNGTCPFPDPPPAQTYWRIGDGDRPCRDFLHPNLLLDLEAVNRKRRKMAYNKLRKYLSQPYWLHRTINSGQRILDIWQRNYRPAEAFYRSFETLILYLKNTPERRKTPAFLGLLRKNIQHSPSHKSLLEDSYERSLWQKLDGMLGG